MGIETPVRRIEVSPDGPPPEYEEQPDPAVVPATQPVPA